jgi:glucose-6-phosphate 1-dehydrogenase
VDNERWRGVPFYISAGKGLASRKTEICIQFRDVSNTMFRDMGGTQSPNKLVIRIQPDESIILSIANKVPGIGMRTEETALDLRYNEAFDEIIPDAYESLILDVIRGDKSLFIRKDELAAAWNIFTPVLHQLEEQGIRPEPYPFGSAGPKSAAKLLERVLSAGAQKADI